MPPTAKNVYLCDMRTDIEPTISIGIMSAPEIRVTFHGTYIIASPDGTPVSGERTFSSADTGIVCTPSDPHRCSFELHGVTIGVGFHWERHENQRFRGALAILADAGKPGNAIAVNAIGLEEYLKSVISSEMSATASGALLRAHAVVSRSWLLRQLLDRGKHTCAERGGWKRTLLPDGREVDELVKWYDREDHTQFDVCADDHCQRYQGITRASNPIVREVIKETRGEVLMDNDTICDARFSKCCGGVTEKFENCWEPVPHSYLTALRDDEIPSYPDLTDEREAEQWIRTSPEAFCNTTDKEILSQVLNNYDQETTDFYRWKVEYTQEELSRLIHRKTGMDFGPIIDLIPLERGSSGRITKLKIVGVRRSFTIGKELEIRRTLSETHLYSSAFVVDKKDIRLDIPSRFILTGAGWGHGVGLCQIGAAVMGAKGYSYRKILTHYFPGASIEKRY